MERRNDHEQDVDARLSAYYGPPLREPLLPLSSWHTLRRNLGPQKRRKRKLWHGLQRPMQRRLIPANVQDAFARVTNQARRSENLSMLRCTLKMKTGDPTVRITSMWRPCIQLTLPIDAELSMKQTELDILLSVGLARLVIAHRFAYRLLQLFAVAFALIGCLVLVYSWIHQMQFLGLPIAVGLLVCAVCIMNMQKRGIALAADRLVVTWLGRSHVCQGLHLLVNHSRRPQRKSWSEPSLKDRIVRVCGTRVESQEDSLTLVR